MNEEGSSNVEIIRRNSDSAQVVKDETRARRVASDKRYYEKHKEQIKNRQQRYNSEHTAPLREYRRHYYQANRAAYRYYQRRYYQENRETINERRRQKYKEKCLVRLKEQSEGIQIFPTRRKK